MPKKKTKEQIKQEMEIGDREGDVYTETGRDELLDEEDELTDVEEGFMEGYSKGEKTFTCANCHKMLNENVIEEEFDNNLMRFCSSACVDKYESKAKNHK